MLRLFQQYEVERVEVVGAGQPQPGGAEVLPRVSHCPSTDSLGVCFMGCRKNGVS